MLLFLQAALAVHKILLNQGALVINLKQLLALSVLLFGCTINAMHEQDKENNNKTVQELLAEIKIQQQAPPRPSTPLNPGNNAHLPYINVLQTADGRKVTRADVYNYIGICIN